MTTRPESEGQPTRILVIKLGALGDFVQALGPMQAIRDHHPNAKITLMTTGPFVDFARASGLFDEVYETNRPGLTEIGAVLSLRRWLRGGGYGRVYDLQTSDRSSFYHRLFWPGPRPEWSGIASGCSHPHDNPKRDFMHTIERQAEQLAKAGIKSVPPANLSWATADLSRFNLSNRTALIMPGGAAHRPDKRWPVARYADLARYLTEQGLEVVLVGGAEEQSLHHNIPGGRSLAGETNLIELATLARQSAIAVGNDTGPAHIAAVAGCPTIVLYSNASDPALCAQRGDAVTLLRQDDLSDLSVEMVKDSIADVLKPSAGSPSC